MQDKIESKPIDYLEELSKFVFVNKFASYNEGNHRREFWTESVLRVKNMHLQQYSYLDSFYKNEIEWAFSFVENKVSIPSMRSLQFGGKAILAHNARMFNCAARFVDSPRSFAEIFYLLLCGCGVTLGLSEKYLNTE